MSKVNPDRIRAGLEALIEVDDQLVLSLIDRLVADDYTGTGLYERIDNLLERVEQAPFTQCFIEISRSQHEDGREGVCTTLHGLPKDFTDENEGERLKPKDLLPLTLEQRWSVGAMNVLNEAGGIIGLGIKRIQDLEDALKDIHKAE